MHMHGYAYAGYAYDSMSLPQAMHGPYCSLARPAVLLIPEVIIFRSGSFSKQSMLASACVLSSCIRIRFNPLAIIGPGDVDHNPFSDAANRDW